jgi:lipoprotein signal peptidase
VAGSTQHRLQPPGTQNGSWHRGETLAHTQVLSKDVQDVQVADESAVCRPVVVPVARPLAGTEPLRNDHDAVQVRGERMSQDTRAVAVPSLRAEPTDEPGQRSIVLALLAMVVLLDQTTKWWAWRHVFGALINPGGDLLVGRIVGGWYADTLTGQLLDLLGVGFVSIAVALLVRRRRPIVVLASAAVMIGGWGSNLLDRLGMHSWTAPGSTRGAVDFLPLSHYRFNLADIFIVGGTALFVLSVGHLRRTAFRR